MSEAAPDLGAMVTKLLGDPELIAQIASTVGIDPAPAAEEGTAAAAEEGERGDGSTSAVGLGQILHVLSMMSGSGRTVGNSAGRCALLSALKPFCNEHRCRTIDYMIGISKLSDTLTQKRG